MNIEEKVLASWDGIRAYVRPGWLYRGQRSADWHLATSLERCMQREDVPPSAAVDFERELLRDIEKLLRNKVPRAEVPVEDPVFIAAAAAERTRQADPGPRGHGHGVSQRPAGSQPGRHARTHAKKPHAGGGGGGGGGAHASSTTAKPTGQSMFSGGPRGRR